MRLFDVSSDLVDFAITTFDVGVETLAALLPAGFEPERVTLDDGRERALVSAVTFTNTRFFVGYAPFVKLRCAQTNYRAYVRHEGRSGCFFFATHLDHPLVAMPRYLWKMPWSRSRVTLEAAWSSAGLGVYDWKGAGGEGEERLRARGLGEPVGTLSGFADASSTHRMLTAPLLGWFRRRDEALATYSVWHAPLELERCAVDAARFECWERLGLVTPGQKPHSVLAQKRTKYLVVLPPRRIG